MRGVASRKHRCLNNDERRGRKEQMGLREPATHRDSPFRRLLESALTNEQKIPLWYCETASKGESSTETLFL
ncbi:hypothetical protein Ddc_05818 [Ditylenchus destructor]|nr:hypothetical protein Ddc_05818 [Ditylenchus destructor]